MPLESLPIAEAGVGAEFALEDAYTRARPVLRRRVQETAVPLAEAFRDRECAPLCVLVLLLDLRCAAAHLLWLHHLHHATPVLPRHVLLPPLYPRQVFRRSTLHRLLGTRSQ